MFKIILYLILMFSFSFSKEIKYGEEYFQKMEVLEKNNDKIIVFVHGGAWLYGNHLESIHSKNTLTNYTFISVGYRVDGDVLNQLEDIKLAINKIKKSYKNSEIILMGHSAGAHLILTTFIKENLNNKIIVLDTNYDYKDKTTGLYDVFSQYDKDTRKKLSPYWLNFTNKNMLIVSSKRNESETYKFVSKFKKQNNIKYSPLNMTHREINVLLGSKQNKDYDKLIKDFIFQ